MPVVLNNQQNPEQNPPYVFYSAYPYNPEMGELGDYSTEQEGDTCVERRRTEPSCSFSLRSVVWTEKKMENTSQERMRPAF